MTEISKSPERNTFQLNGYLERCKSEGKEPSQAYLNMWESAKEQDEKNMKDPDRKKNNMEYDLRSTEWILEKVRKSDEYAQNLYAAICNNNFTKNDVWPILKEEIWGASWRYAGGIIADMRQEGDYIDWYCSGIGGGLGNGDEDGTRGYVAEGVVTDEIRKDLLKLGWIVRENEEDEY